MNMFIWELILNIIPHLLKLLSDIYLELSVLCLILLPKVVPLDILFELFDKVVLPVVLHASETYGNNDSYIKKLEIFQRSLYKKALKLSKSTPSVMIYGETGVPVANLGGGGRGPGPPGGGARGPAPPLEMLKV